MGVCGKTPEVSALQDLLLYRLKGLAGVAVHARSVAGISDPDADEFFNLAIFSTLTNVNFDDERFVKYIKQTNRYIAGLKQKLEAAGAAPVPVPQVVLSRQPPIRASLKGLQSITRDPVAFSCREGSAHGFPNVVSRCHGSTRSRILLPGTCSRIPRTSTHSLTWAIRSCSLAVNSTTCNPAVMRSHFYGGIF